MAVARGGEGAVEEASLRVFGADEAAIFRAVVKLKVGTFLGSARRTYDVLHHLLAALLAGVATLAHNALFFAVVRLQALGAQLESTLLLDAGGSRHLKALVAS